MRSTLFDCDAVLFDMDGTIVDSRSIIERMWTIWATEHGLSVKAALALAHGRRTLETMALLAPHLPVCQPSREFLAMLPSAPPWD